MKKTTKRKHTRTGYKGGKSEIATEELTQGWTFPKRRVTQADVDQAAKRSEVETQATIVANLRSRVTDLRVAQAHLEGRLQQTRTDLSTTMLAHLEAVNKFKDMTALQHEVP